MAESEELQIAIQAGIIGYNHSAVMRNNNKLQASMSTMDDLLIKMLDYAKKNIDDTLLDDPQNMINWYNANDPHNTILLDKLLEDVLSLKNGNGGVTYNSFTSADDNRVTTTAGDKRNNITLAAAANFTSTTNRYADLRNIG